MTATNVMTTLGGILAAVGTAGIGLEAVPPEYKWVFTVLAAGGTILLGYSAKGKDEHSTLAEVEKATAQVEQKEVEQKAQQKGG